MNSPDEKLTPEKPQSEEDTELIDDGTMSLTAHLEELRSRLIKSLVAIAIGSVISYFFLDEIMHYLTLNVGKLYYMKPGEAFFTYIKIDIATGFLIALPVIFYHAWRFFLPALTSAERMVLGIIVPSSVFLFFVGLAFSFFLVLPIALKFFIGFGDENLQAMFSFGNYFDFVVMFLLPFGFIFELPLVIIVLGKIGILTSEWLKKYRRIVIFLSFVIGAIITPTPDIFTQSMIALPMIALYEIGYLVLKYILRR
ncbi:MAG: twin-arginine translocase subunit TatC [Selenomonadaceae bacterium]|nr:twin-arginine translocase subunit TatC [Selenomonadaceae bacterium]